MRNFSSRDFAQRDLTQIDFAEIALRELSDRETIEVCGAALLNIQDANAAAPLRDAAHQFARHADMLDRLVAEQPSGITIGQSLPGDGACPTPGDLAASGGGSSPNPRHASRCSPFSWIGARVPSTLRRHLGAIRISDVVGAALLVVLVFSLLLISGALA